MTAVTRLVERLVASGCTLILAACGSSDSGGRGGGPDASAAQSGGSGGGYGAGGAAGHSGDSAGGGTSGGGGGAAGGGGTSKAGGAGGGTGGGGTAGGGTAGGGTAGSSGAPDGGDGDASTGEGGPPPSSCGVGAACNAVACASLACFDDDRCQTSTAHYWGAEWHDYGEAVLVTPENDRVLVGYTNLTNLSGGNSDLFAAKLGRDGQEIWAVRWGTAAVEYLRKGALDAQGNVYVVGDTQGALEGQQNAGKRDVFVTKITASGTRAWTTLFGTANDDGAYDVGVNAAGDRIVVAGYWSFAGTDMETAFVAHLDGSGAVVKNALFDGWGRAEAETVELGAADHVFVTGRVDATIPGHTSAGKADAFAAELGRDLDIVWTTQWGSGEQDWTNGSALDANGNLYVTGTTSGAIGGNPAPNRGDWTAFLSRIEPGGRVAWTRVYNDGADTRGGDVAVTGGGDLFLAGTVLGQLVPDRPRNGSDIFWMRLCADGGRKAVEQWTLGDDDWGWSVAEDRNGNAVVGGYARRDPDLGGGSHYYDGFVLDVAPQ